MKALTTIAMFSMLKAEEKEDWAEGGACWT